ncbi:MAG: TolC family protein [Polyangiales bacterium]
MHRPLIPLCLALLGAPALALAQTDATSAPVEVSLQDALRRAWVDPPAVVAALARVEAASLQVGAARAAYLPSVTLSTSPQFSYSDRPSFAAGLGPSRLRSSALSVDATASARMTLSDFGRTAGAVRGAEAGADAAREDARAARLQSLSTAAVAYLTVLNDRENLASLDATIAQREAHLRIAEGLVSTGSRPAIEAVRAQLNLESARLDRAAAAERAASNVASLAAALGVDPLRDLRVAAAPEGVFSSPLDPASASRRAMAMRPEFAAARHRLSQAQAQLDAARAGRLPTLSASASVGASLSEVLEGNGLGGVSQTASAGVALSWPLFDANVRANIGVAEANVEVARRNLETQTLQVRTAAVQAAVSARAAQATLTQAERLAEVAAANLTQAAGRYEAGAAQLLELVDAQAADAAARVSVVRARLNALTARAQLLAATGDLEALSRP